MSGASKKPSKPSQRTKQDITELPDDKVMRKLFPKEVIKHVKQAIVDKRIVDRPDDSEQPPSKKRKK